MTTILTDPAKERSTYVINAAPKDETGAAVVPLTLVWKLTDEAGNVVNSRSAVALTPATSVDIVLHGADLAVGSNGLERRVTITGTYTSTLGVGLELNDDAIFSILPMAGVTD